MNYIPPNYVTFSTLLLLPLRSLFSSPFDLQYVLPVMRKTNFHFHTKQSLFFLYFSL